MDQEKKNMMLDLHFDLDNTLERFMGNEDLYVRFLKKFLQDKSYAELVEAIDQKDYERAFKSGHTLKGVAANLGMNGLCARLTPVVEHFRGGVFTENDADMMTQIENEYMEIRDVIKKL